MKPTDWNKKVKLEFQRPHYHLVSVASLWKNVKPDKFEMKSDIFSFGLVQCAGKSRDVLV